MDENRPELKKLVELCAKAAELASADLEGRDRLGELSFADNIAYVERILEIIQELRVLPIEILPQGRRETLYKLIQGSVNVIEQIKNFSAATSSNPRETRDKLANLLIQKFDELFEGTFTTISYLRSSPVLFSTLAARQSDAIAAIDAAQAATSASIHKLEQEATDIVASMREAAAKAGVSAHAVHFAEQAKEHLRAGRGWLATTIALASLAAVVAFWSFYSYLTRAPKIDASQGFQILAAKLVLFSIFYFAMIWGARNYRAHRHNYVMAKHRQNALSTFQAFANATADDATRNAVLLRATEAIFLPGLSGYVPGEPEPQGSTQILEILRGGKP